MDSTDHTFVICAYKESEYLEDCIRSLKRQSLKSKIIMYSSTPNNFIKTLGEKYEIPFYTKAGGGIGKDWNNALSFITTKYVTIAHQDDVYLNHYLKNIMEKIDEDTLIAYSDYKEWKDGEVIAKNLNLKIKRLMLNAIDLFPKNKVWRLRILAFGNPICCPAVTYNLDKINPFKFNETLRVSLDWLAWYEISKMEGKFQFINKDLMYHRIHEDSETTNTISDNTRTKEDILMYRKFWPRSVANLLIKFYAKSQTTNN
ncbi:hypothetical protein IGI65_001423 [Enterococcus sp. DIV0755b]|uniref:glycosyltransferase family 2 protein n=1 Tax=Enterococcus sp. DIV0755b TaxID=2774657 RepID=UPI003F294F18